MPGWPGDRSRTICYPCSSRSPAFEGLFAVEIQGTDDQRPGDPLVPPSAGRTNAGGSVRAPCGDEAPALPDADGLWPESVVSRLDAVMEFGPRARSLERRVLLLHQAGYVPALAFRRVAAGSVVRTIRPGARKMTRVRHELDALA